MYVCVWGRGSSFSKLPHSSDIDFRFKTNIRGIGAKSLNIFALFTRVFFLGVFLDHVISILGGSAKTLPLGTYYYQERALVEKT